MNKKKKTDAVWRTGSQKPWVEEITGQATVALNIERLPEYGNSRCVSAARCQLETQS